MTLANLQCSACRPDSPKVSPARAQLLLAQLPDWRLISEPGQRKGDPSPIDIDKLSKTYGFKNFAQALAFANRVGSLAEAENHHPAILVEWGKVTVTWWTHAIGGLHENDFILAGRCDEVVETTA